MRRVIATSLLALALGALPALADTVVRKDGRHFTGEVTRTSTGYSIVMPYGTIEVADDEVQEFYAGDYVPPAAPAAHTGASTSAHPATAPSAGVAMDTRSLQILLTAGQESLASGEWKAARDAFLDAATIDPRNVTALHGAAIAYMRLDDFAHARQPMERALMVNAIPNRAVVSNAAALELGLKTPMRAVKFIRDYLTARSTELDEPLANLLYITLDAADDQAKKQEYYRSCQQFYAAYNAKLNAAKPGWKRWGPQWLPAQRADQLMARAKSKQREADGVAEDIQRVTARVDDARADYEKLRDLARGGMTTGYEVREARDTLNETEDELAGLKTQYADALAAIPKPNFPKQIKLVAMDDLTVPPVGITAVAIALPAADAPAHDSDGPATAPAHHRHPRPVDQTADGAAAPTTVAIAAAPAPLLPPPIVIEAPAIEHKKLRINSYAAAFPIGPDLVITASAPLEDAIEIVLQAADGTAVPATLLRKDDSGLALLRVNGRKLVPLSLAASFAGGAIACAGYPSVNIFNPVPEIITGTASAPGDAAWSIHLTRHPRVGGGPLVAGGKLVGVELATRDSDVGDVPAASLEQIKRLLGPDMPPASGRSPDPCAIMLQLMATRETQ